MKIIWDNTQAFHTKEGDDCLTFNRNGRRLTVGGPGKGEEEFSLVEVEPEVMSSHQVEMSSDK